MRGGAIYHRPNGPNVPATTTYGITSVPISRREGLPVSRSGEAVASCGSNAFVLGCGIKPSEI